MKNKIIWELKKKKDKKCQKKNNIAFKIKYGIWAGIPSAACRHTIKGQLSNPDIKDGKGNQKCYVWKCHWYNLRIIFYIQFKTCHTNLKRKKQLHAMTKPNMGHAERNQVSCSMQPKKI